MPERTKDEARGVSHVTIAQAARFLENRITQAAVWQRVDAGAIPHRMVYGVKMVPVAALRRIRRELDLRAAVNEASGDAPPAEDYEAFRADQ